MAIVFVRPGEGRRVRMPETGEIVPAEGMSVTLDMFVARRLADGDLVAAPAPAEAPAEPDTTPARRK